MGYGVILSVSRIEADNHVTVRRSEARRKACSVEDGQRSLSEKILALRNAHDDGLFGDERNHASDFSLTLPFGESIQPRPIQPTGLRPGGVRQNHLYIRRRQQAVRGQHHEVFATFLPTMIGYDRPVSSQAGNLKIGSDRRGELARHGWMQQHVIPCEGQHTVFVTGDDFVGDLLLAAQGIDRDGGSVQVEQSQSRRNWRPALSLRAGVPSLPQHVLQCRFERRASKLVAGLLQSLRHHAGAAQQQFVGHFAEG